MDPENNQNIQASFLQDFSFQNLKNTFFSKTGKDASKLFISNIVATGIGLAASLITLKIFNVNEIGILASTNNLVGIVAGIILSGINISFVRYLSDYLKKDKAIASALTKQILKIEFIFAISAFIVIFFSSSFLANEVFHKSDLDFFIKLAAINIFLSIAISFYKTYFQALEKFSFISLSIIIPAILNISCIGFLAYLNALTPESVLYISIGITGLFLFISLWYYQKNKIQTETEKKLPNEFLKKFLHYSKWVVLMAVTSLIFSRIDIFMLTSMVDLGQVALYSFAFTIYSTYLIVLNTINTVLLPKISSFQTYLELRIAAKKIFKFSILIAIIILPTIFFIRPLTQFIFQNKFDGSMPVIYVFFLSLLISIIVNPIVNILLVIKRQKFLSLLTFAILILNVIGNLIFIPRYGIIGAVWVTACTHIFSNVIAGIKVMLELKNKYKTSDTI
ncbi:MAG: oligosaccharide flippase family protein [Patescibacteria group bacterium]